MMYLVRFVNILLDLFVGFYFTKGTKYTISTGHYADINITQKQIDIFKMMKGPFASTQGLKARMHCIVAYKAAEFFIFLMGGYDCYSTY